MPPLAAMPPCHCRCRSFFSCYFASAFAFHATPPLPRHLLFLSLITHARAADADEARMRRC